MIGPGVMDQFGRKILDSPPHQSSSSSESVRSRLPTPATDEPSDHSERSNRGVLTSQGDHVSASHGHFFSSYPPHSQTLPQELDPRARIGRKTDEQDASLRSSAGQKALAEPERVTSQDRPSSEHLWRGRGKRTSKEGKEERWRTAEGSAPGLMPARERSPMHQERQAEGHGLGGGPEGRPRTRYGQNSAPSMEATSYRYSTAGVRNLSQEAKPQVFGSLHKVKEDTEERNLNLHSPGVRPCGPEPSTGSTITAGSTGETTKSVQPRFHAQPYGHGEMILVTGEDNGQGEMYYPQSGQRQPQAAQQPGHAVVSGAATAQQHSPRRPQQLRRLTQQSTTSAAEQMSDDGGSDSRGASFRQWTFEEQFRQVSDCHRLVCSVLVDCI